MVQILRLRAGIPALRHIRQWRALGMFAALFQGQANSEVFFIHARRCRDGGDAGFRASDYGLIRQDMRDRFGLLDGLGILDQNPGAAPAQLNHNRHRRGHPRAQGRDNQNSDGVHQGIGQRRFRANAQTIKVSGGRDRGDK